MKAYIAKRFIRYIGTLWLILTVTFVLFRLVPGDPTITLVAGDFNPETQQAMIERFGLDRPMHEQYVIYMINFLQGDFGTSFTYSQSVSSLLLPRLLNSLLIAGPGIICIAGLAYFLGSFSGWNKGKRVESTLSYLIVSGRAIPHFVLGLFLLMGLSHFLGLFPTGGMGPVDAPHREFVELITTPSFYWYLALPLLTFVLHYLSEPYLLMRGMIKEDKQAEYVRFYRLKGFAEKDVKTFAARNNLLPLITYIPPLIAITTGGLILIEVVFSWTGIGWELVDAVNRRDYPVAQGAFFIFAFLVVTGNLVADIAYTYLDPRVELEGGE